MKTLLTKIAVATAAGTALSMGIFNINPAEAASFNFSYTLQNGSILSGMLDGDLQADGDTVFVSAINMPTFNGVAGPDLPFVQSAIGFSTGNFGQTATVSFSGNLMDIIACTDSNCFEGFAFEGSGAIFGFPLYDSSSSYGNTTEPYNPQNWQLTAKNTTPVPEPASVLGLLAVGAVGVVSKLKKGKV
ncbi:MAG TPA: PEP-CTERM sorting domain-containing protein [Cyanobacteria bacterium UBA11149]|nr:PEP-CTERM sorting domain-containing protein [Cyanobacteria bacterium UBA11367]HBE58106.1 PEP-CTERM sorting domain-containing protein [Cyanobacteria bacterium UBA11366]HBK64180.1 PEP-CTERM sorting domain-containing protein [Cyanobacteria bacterium UBA11166]HBR77177.1 PEP-CTERM sorting domain-containing protein [Cyanobacteria bacterium UBA11159]HBS71230.1 PEP-CTERM sorting domain-containing protein [Cyanobacteria bacterium UBA11153]HBW88123.1 PEP-CTERM sorting domain-containing protein [Cyano